MQRSIIVSVLAGSIAFVATAVARQSRDVTAVQEPAVKQRVEFESFAFRTLVEELTEQGGAWKACFENETLQCGVYRIPAGGTDAQKPHAEDELYYVVAGRAKFTAGAKTIDVQPGAVLFVAAEVEHRFHDVDEALEVLVFFSKAKVEPPR